MIQTIITVATIVLSLAVIGTIFPLIRIRRNTPPDRVRARLRPWQTTMTVCLLLLCGVQAGGYIYNRSLKPADMGNPFFAEWTTPFAVPPFDLIRAEHFRPAFEEAMRRHRAEIDSITSSPQAPTFANTVEAYDRSGEMYSTVSMVFGCLTAAETTPELEAIKAELSPLRSAHGDAIAMDSLLFARVKAVYDNRNDLNPAQKRLTETVYRRFTRSGALLS
ncbi:MAG: hypothetical protein LBV18_07345, partial [Alistipes sp.]|nr:hypothetical protein [Alistipes sp.]